MRIDRYTCTAIRSWKCNFTITRDLPLSTVALTDSFSSLAKLILELPISLITVPLLTRSVDTSRDPLALQARQAIPELCSFGTSWSSLSASFQTTISPLSHPIARIFFWGCQHAAVQLTALCTVACLRVSPWERQTKFIKLSGNGPWWHTDNRNVS